MLYVLGTILARNKNANLPVSWMDTDPIYRVPESNENKGSRQESSLEIIVASSMLHFRNELDKKISVETGNARDISVSCCPARADQDV
jgi:hypothetical protein